MKSETSISDLKNATGQQVSLCGWLYNSRSSGKVQFLVLRDGTGLCQCIVEKGKIPDELFEAADIAGATNWKTFRHIKLPLLKPIIGVVSILTFTGNFNAFDVVFAMAGPNGSPDFSTDILGTFFYRVGIAGKHPVGIPDMGMGAAVATVVFVVLFIGVGILRLMTQDRSGRK